MTCIVGITHKGKVYLGGDSAGANSAFSLTVVKQPKVFVNGEFVMGYTDSFRIGMLLEHDFKPPMHFEAVESLEKFMAVKFVDAVRTCFKAGGYARKHDEHESGGEFLVGFKGRLFRIQGDYSVLEDSAGFDAVGCGDNYALGALEAMDPASDPKVRIKNTLAIAEKRSAGVRAPFHICSV